MKRTSLFLPSAAASLFAAAVLAVATVAQAPQSGTTQQPMAGGPPPAEHDHGAPAPAPTNLKVLPKDLTGDQVHEIMERWEAALGAHCNTCHTADPKNIGPNGRPRLNFADDSKPEKAAARMMYTMTNEINKTYVSMVDDKAAPVTCGTCHRGHLKPEAFIPPPDEHGGPHPPQAPVQAPEHEK